MTLNSNGAEYIIECQVETGGRWRTVGREMEKIVVGPIMQLADLFFRVPRELVRDNGLRVRFRAVLGTERLNAYRLSVAAVP